MPESSSEHTRKVIKAKPLHALQERFVTHAIRGTLDATVKDELLQALDQLVSVGNRPFYTAQQANIAAAMKQGVAPRLPDISSPETSLLWAIQLAFLAQSQPHFYDSPLWQQFIGPEGAAQTEKEALSFHLACCGVPNDTRIKWGELGSSFYFSPDEHMINLDLILALGVGFDVSRAASFHEIGHSILTKGFGEKITMLREQVVQLQEKAKTTALTPEEYQAMHRMNAQARYRFYIFDEAENNVVDRWTVNQGRRIQRDHVLARNTTEAALVDGMIGKDSDFLADDTPEHRFINVKKAIRYSFFRNNAYFPDTEEGWREVGINPDWITTRDGQSGMAALAILKELCGGKEGVEYLQPDSRHMMQGTARLMAAYDEFSQRRNARIEEVYDQFVDPIIESMLDGQQQQRGQQMQQQQQRQGQGQGSAGQQDGQGGDNQAQQTQGKEQGGKGADDASQPPAPSRAGNEKTKGAARASGQQSPGSEQKEGESSPDTSSTSQENSSSSPEAGGDKQPAPVKVKGVGKMPGVKPLPATPQQAHAEQTPGTNKPSHGATPDKGQTIAELEEARERRKVPASDPRSHTDAEGATAKQSPFVSATVGGAVVDVSPIGDWSDYKAMAIQFSAEIRSKQKHIDQLRARQHETSSARSYKRSLLPEDGDMRRLIPGAHTQMHRKILRGTGVTEEDACRFEEDDEAKKPAAMDIIFLSDGSGSMFISHGMDGSSWPYPPIHAAMHAGCVLNEACKNDVRTDRNISFYMGLWGNQELQLLAQPGDKPQGIGMRIAGVVKDQAWGTSLAPSIRGIVTQLQNGQKNPRAALESGSSHILILSDGGIADENASYQMFQKLLQCAPLVTVDFLVIETGKTQMDALAEKLTREFPGQVNVKHYQTPTHVHEGIDQLLRERIVQTPATRAVTRAEKIAQLGRAEREFASR